MASYSVARAAHKTLSTTTVDTVTLTRKFRRVKVINRDNTNPIWVTYGSAPADPVANADDIDIVMPGQTLDISMAGARTSTSTNVVKVLGNGGAYSVIGV